MIASIKGHIIHTDLHFVIIDVKGVGYKVYTQTKTIADIVFNEEIQLWTYLVVRENALDLYGFSTLEEQELFELLISVSGIGPKSGLSILDLTTPELLRQAVAEEDISPLTQVSGIGKKNAQKIILELKGKLETKEGDMQYSSHDNDAFEALHSMGYSQTQVRKVLHNLPKEIKDTENKIKEALKHL